VASVVCVLTACSAASVLPSGGSLPDSPFSSVVPTASPSVSHASGQIVFENHPMGAEHHQIWIAWADGSNIRQLVVSPADDDVQPSFSPDGTTVLFTRANSGQAYFVDLDGANLRPLARCQGDCGRDPEGDAWSPDGRQLAVVQIYPPFDANGEPAKVNIWTIKLEGTGVREVTNPAAGSLLEDQRPAWSPDGKRIAFRRGDYSQNPPPMAIFTIAIDGTDLRQVTPRELNADNPEWSPDGSLISFNSPAGSLEPGREQNIFTIHPDGTGLVQLTAHMTAYADGSQGTFDASWSPDGTQLIFTHIPSFGGPADLYVINRDGTDLHVLVRTELNESHAVWGVSPTR
jgi:Tol biopolymer transport system component